MSSTYEVPRSSTGRDTDGVDLGGDSSPKGPSTATDRQQVPRGKTSSPNAPGLTSPLGAHSLPGFPITALLDPRASPILPQIVSSLRAEGVPLRSLPKHVPPLALKSPSLSASAPRPCLQPRPRHFDRNLVIAGQVRKIHPLIPGIPYLGTEPTDLLAHRCQDVCPEFLTLQEGQAAWHPQGRKMNLAHACGGAVCGHGKARPRPREDRGLGLAT